MEQGGDGGASKESDQQRIQREAEEEKERSFAKSKLFINNNVFTTKIEMNDNAHPRDPRIVQEEYSTYIPKPFAAYVTSLSDVRPRSTMKSEYFDRPGIDSISELTDRNAPKIAERDIYVFAMLCGLRSVSQESVEEIQTITNKTKQKRQKRQKQIRSSADLGEEEGEGPSMGETGAPSSLFEINDLWNDDPTIETDCLLVLRKAEEKHGAKKYQKAPHNRFLLEELVRRMDGRSARCVPPRFAAVIERYKYPSTSVSVFSPGKVVCTGAKTEAVGHYAIMETLAYIREKGFPRACPLSNSLEAENVVGTIEFDFGLDIDALHAKYPNIVSYNKEAFPGATVRPPLIFPAAQLAFESGKTVTMGGRGREGLMRILSVTFSLYYDVRKERKRKGDSDVKKKKSTSKKRQKRKANPSK